MRENVYQIFTYEDKIYMEKWIYYISDDIKWIQIS